MWDPSWRLKEVCPGHLLLQAGLSSPAFYLRQPPRSSDYTGQIRTSCLSVMSHPTVDSLRSKAGGTSLHPALPQGGQAFLHSERRDLTRGLFIGLQHGLSLSCDLPRDVTVSHPSHPHSHLPPGLTSLSHDAGGCWCHPSPTHAPWLSWAPALPAHPLPPP